MLKLLAIVVLFSLSGVTWATDCVLTASNPCTISLPGGTTPLPPVPPSVPPPIPPTDPGTVHPGTKPPCATNYTFLNWNGTAIERRGYSGGFAVDGIWVIEFRTPAGYAGTSLPKVTAAEWNSSPSTRTAVLSTVPCDFSGTALGYGSTSISNSVTVAFAIGNKPNWYTPAAPVASVMYYNIKNSENPSCASTGVCDMFVDLVVPTSVSAARTTAKGVTK